MQTAVDEAKERINKEYTEWCAKAGDVQYKLLCFQGELNFINNKLKEINDEATKLKQENIHVATSVESLAAP